MPRVPQRLASFPVLPILSFLRLVNPIVIMIIRFVVTLPVVSGQRLETLQEELEMSYITRLAVAGVTVLMLHGCGGGGDGDTANPAVPGTEEPTNPETPTEPETPVSVGACATVAGDCVEQLGVGDISKLGDWTLDSYIDPPKIMECSGGADCLYIGSRVVSSHYFPDGFYSMPYPKLEKSEVGFFYEVESIRLYEQETVNTTVTNLPKYGAILVGYPRVQREGENSNVQLTVPFIVMSHNTQRVSKNPDVYRDGFRIDEAMIVYGDKETEKIFLNSRYFFAHRPGAGVYGGAGWRTANVGNSFDQGDEVYYGLMIFGSDVISAVNETTPLMCQNNYTIGKSGAVTIHQETMHCIVQWKENDWFAISVPTDTTVNNPDLQQGVKMLNEHIDNAARDPNTDHYFAMVAKRPSLKEFAPVFDAYDASNLVSVAATTEYLNWGSTSNGAARHWMQSVTSELNKRYDPQLSLAQGRLVPRVQ